MIVAAAINVKGIIFTGVRHADIIEDIMRLPVEFDLNTSENGFIDNKNNYYGRAEAKRVAIEAGQVSPRFEGKLISDDLW